MIGGAALLADGVITPAITVTSSIEGLKLLNPEIPVILIVLLIFAVLFFVQQFGTNSDRQFFWSDNGYLVFNAWDTWIFQADAYILRFLKLLILVMHTSFLKEYPGGFILLGSSVSLYNGS